MWTCHCGTTNQDSASSCTNCGSWKPEIISNNNQMNSGTEKNFQKNVDFSEKAKKGIEDLQAVASDIPLIFIIFAIFVPLYGVALNLIYIAQKEEEKAKKILIIMLVAYIVFFVVGFIIGFVFGFLNKILSFFR